MCQKTFVLLCYILVLLSMLLVVDVSDVDFSTFKATQSCSIVSTDGLKQVFTYTVYTANNATFIKDKKAYEEQDLTYDLDGFDGIFNCSDNVVFEDIECKMFNLSFRNHYTYLHKIRGVRRC